MPLRKSSIAARLLENCPAIPTIKDFERLQRCYRSHWPSIIACHTSSTESGGLRTIDVAPRSTIFASCVLKQVAGELPTTRATSKHPRTTLRSCTPAGHREPRLGSHDVTTAQGPSEMLDDLARDVPMGA